MQTESVQIGLWIDLLKEGQVRAHVTLSETEESYTAIMLQRFILCSELTGITLALEYLESQAKNRTLKKSTLGYAADAGLILAGLFPERAKKKNVPVSYLTGMSQVCFFELAQVCETMNHYKEAQQYHEVGRAVERLAYVLYCMRRKNSTIGELLPFIKPSTLH